MAINKTKEVSKITLEGVEIPIHQEGFDFSATTATEQDVVSGKVFYNASGEKTTGTYKDMLQQRIDATNSCAYLFFNYLGTGLLDISKLNTSQATSMSNMFNGCNALTTIGLSNINTSNVTEMQFMFQSCNALTTIDLSNFNTSNVTNMSNMFYGCKALKTLDLSNFDTSKVTNMSNMFHTNWKLEALNLSNFNTSKVTNMSSMFESCQRLINLDLSNFNTSLVSNFNKTFTECYKLTTIIGDLDLIKTTTASSMLGYCRELTSVTLKNIKINLQIGSGTSYGHLLTLESLLNTIKELWTNTSGTKTLTMGTANTAKLANVYVKLIDITDEMRAEDEYIDNKAPFVVCESTDEGAMLITEYVTNVKKWQLA